MATSTETSTFRVIAEYNGATNYHKYDVVTYNGAKWWAKRPTTGNTPSEGINWTQKWFFVPTSSQQVQREPHLVKVKFGDGYLQTTPVGFNFDHHIEFSFSWEGVTDRETKGILEFVREQLAFKNTTTIVSDESQSGFWYQPPFPYQKYAGIFIISGANLDFSSYNKNNFTVDLRLKKLQASA